MSLKNIGLPGLNFNNRRCSQ